MLPWAWLYPLPNAFSWHCLYHLVTLLASLCAACHSPLVWLPSLCGRRQDKGHSTKERLWSCASDVSQSKHSFIVLQSNPLMFLQEFEAFEQSSSKNLYPDNSKTVQGMEETVVCTLRNEICLDHGSSQYDSNSWIPTFWAFLVSEYSSWIFFNYETFSQAQRKCKSL